jgi:signal transduction histidine kinase/ligand-binding sensor domain-containing protein
MRTPRLTVAVLAAAAAFGPAARAGGAPAAPGYFARNWTVDDGVPHDVVNGIVQDGRGCLWLATSAGLARFDGRSFREYPLPNLSLDHGYNIRAIAASDCESLLFLPAWGDVVSLRNGVFSPHPVSRWVHGQSILALFPESSGGLWLGMGDGGLVHWIDGRVERFGAAEGIRRHGADFSFARDGAGRTWIAGGDFLVRYDRGRLVPFPGRAGTDALIAPSRSGGLWISTRERLLKWDAAGTAAYSPAPIWPEVQRAGVEQMYEDRQGGLWIATRRRGLFRFADGRLDPEPSPSQILTSVTADAEGDIWVASNGGGISELRPRPFVRLGTSAGFPDETSSAVCAGPDGAIWCADRGGGVVRWDGGRPEVLAGPPDSQPFYANTVFPGAGGDLWVGAFSGLYRIPPGLPRRFVRVAPEVRDVRILYRARNGDLWVASPSHLGTVRDGTYREITAAQGFSGDVVGAVAEDPEGTVWVAVERELFAWQGGRLVRQISADRFPGGHIQALVIEPDGTFWVGTARGLVLIRGGRMRCFLKSDGLADDLIAQVIPDGRGLLWLAGRRGLFHVAIADLEAVADGRKPSVVSAGFGADEGLVGAAPISVCQPAVWRTSDGMLWFTTYAGVVGLDPAEASKALPAPPIFLDEALVDRRPAAEGYDLRIPPGSETVEFRFVAPTFIAPDMVQVRHQLLGYDTDWVDSGSERSARYSRLPPGRYVLRVAARHSDGVWGPPVAIQSVTVVPMWWQTWWGQSGALAAFTALVVLVARYWSQRALKVRLRRLEQERSLERERARIARNLHDELGTGLTQLGMLAHRLKRMCRGTDLAAGLGQLASKTRRITSELEGIVWTVSPKNNSLASFAGFIVRFARDYFQDTDISCVVRGAESIPPCVLTPDTQHHLLAIAKEALNNALKYSCAARVEIGFAFARGEFTLTIADDGVGFSPDAAEHAERNGLSNMRFRVKEIGGRLRIESSPQRGTSLEIRVPVAGAWKHSGLPA